MKDFHLVYKRGRKNWGYYEDTIFPYSRMAMNIVNMHVFIAF